MGVIKFLKIRIGLKEWKKNFHSFRNFEEFILPEEKKNKNKKIIGVPGSATVFLTNRKHTQES